MKKTFWLLLFVSNFFVSVNSYSQIQTFGIMRNGSTQAIQLATINPATGVVNTISTNTFANSYVGNGISTIDPINKIYYVESLGKFFGVNMNTGIAISSPTISTPFPGYFDMMVFNCSDTTIYGLMRNSSTQALRLAKINPVTGVVSTISPTSFTTSYVWNGWATIDRINKIYYVQSGGKIWGISLTSGTLVTSPTVTFPFPGYFDMMIYNNNNATLYGLMRNSATQAIQLAELNVGTGIVTTISTNTFANTFILNGGSAIDPANGIYYIQSGGKFWGIDLVTGTVVSSPTISVPFTGYFDMMEMNINNCNGNYDVAAHTNSTTGLNNNSTEFETFDIFPNPSNGSFSIKKVNTKQANVIIYNITGQKVLEQDINSLSTQINTGNFPKGIYYCILIEENNKVTTRKLFLE